MFTERPVIAERTERHIPKDDLLTPRDLAKAFQKEFGMQQDNYEPHYKIPGQTTRQIKIVLAGTAGLAVAFLLGVQAIHMLSDKPARQHAPLASVTPPTSVPLPAPHVSSELPDARLAAANIAFSQPQPIGKAPTPYSTPYVAPQPPTPPAPMQADPKPLVTSATPAPAQAPAPKKSVAIAMNTVSPIMMDTTPIQINEDDPAMLWNAGLNAESNGNFVAAVRAYERIQSLPSSQWPAQLNTRLQLARKELKGDLN
jgi:peptidoglycan hydrolase-like protein with peptidoglycan-binding domain